MHCVTQIEWGFFGLVWLVGWFSLFFFFLKPLVLELAYFCPANIHGPTELSSLQYLQVLLLHLIT